ncbi:MAG: O-antigen ligase family protein, partial [Caldilineaceae bacterium]|nr:O-antigen ligase family protein [Caldilineaceae bacterium]
DRSVRAGSLSTRLRVTLAVLRLGLLFAILCALLVQAGLAWRWVLDSGLGLDRVLTQRAGPGSDIPFAGVTVQLQHDSPQRRAATLAELAAAGFGWVRQRVDWASVEPHPGDFAWSDTDELLDAVTQADLVPVVVLDGSPGWARAPQDRLPDNPLAPPADPAAFASFAAEFARRYGDKVRFYQIWDEPNIAPHWGARHIDPVAYAQLLRAAAATIRAVDPDAVIVVAALAPTADRGHAAIDEVYFLKRMIAAGASSAMDVIALQPFGFGDAPDNLRQGISILNFQRAAMLRRALIAAGLGDRPVWAVRYGWNRVLDSPWGTVTEEKQALYAVAALEWAWREWPWLAAMGWAIERPATPFHDPTWGFALTAPDGQPTPLLSALRSWQTAPDRQQPRRPRLSGQVPSTRLALWLVLLAGTLAALWRAVAAGRIVPWRSWLARYRRAPPAVRWGSWAVLLLTYHVATWPPLLALCWLGAIFLCLADPETGLWLAMTLLPFYYWHKDLRLVNVVLAVPPAHALALCLVPATLLRLPRRQFQMGFATGIPVALLVISLFSLGTVWHWVAYGQGLLDLVVIPVLLWLEVRVLATTDRAQLRTALALLGGGLLVAIPGLAGWLAGDGIEVDGIRRLVGPHYSPNHTALYLLRTFFVAFGLGLTLSRRNRAWLAAAAGGVLWALILTGSRGALLLGLPAGAVVLAFLAVRRRPGIPRWLRGRPRLRYGLTLGIVIAVTAVMVLQWDRLLNEQTVFHRVDLWEAALALWREHMLAGVGPGGFFWNYPAYLPLGTAIESGQSHPHNVWLEVAITWGLPGVLWLLVAIFAAIRAVRRTMAAPSARFWLTVGLGAAFAAALAHAQSDTFMLLADLAGWNAVAWALITAPAEDERNETQTHNVLC